MFCLLLHTEKLFQAGGVELSSWAMVLETPAFQQTAANHSSAYQNTLKSNVLPVSLSTTALFEI